MLYTAEYVETTIRDKIKSVLKDYVDNKTSSKSKGECELCVMVAQKKVLTELLNVFEGEDANGNED